MEKARCEVVHAFFTRVKLAYESLRAAFYDEVDIDHVHERVGFRRGDCGDLEPYIRHVAEGVHYRFRLDCFFRRPVGPIHEKCVDLGGIFNESNLIIGRVPVYESTVAVRRDVQIDPSCVVRKDVEVEHFCVLGGASLSQNKTSRPAERRDRVCYSYTASLSRRRGAPLIRS